MIYVDDMGHMIADTEDELHEFARRLKLKRSWYQDKGKYPHYDLTTKRKRNKAVILGAKQVTSRQIIKISKKLKGEISDGS